MLRAIGESRKDVLDQEPRVSNGTTVVFGGGPGDDRSPCLYIVFVTYNDQLSIPAVERPPNTRNWTPGRYSAGGIGLSA